MPKTLAFGVGHADPVFNFEKCLADRRVRNQRGIIPNGPSHFKNGQTNLPWNVSRKRGCNQSVNKRAKGESIAFEVSRNAFSVGFEAAGYPVFETGPGLVVGETEFPQFGIDPNGKCQANQSSIVV